jgi:hypothetical protein
MTYHPMGRRRVSTQNWRKRQVHGNEHEYYEWQDHSYDIFEHVMFLSFHFVHLGSKGTRETGITQRTGAVSECSCRI